MIIDNVEIVKMITETIEDCEKGIIDKEARTILIEDLVKIYTNKVVKSALDAVT